EVVEPLVDAVMDGAISKQAGKTTPAGVEQALCAFDVEKRVLLPGEARRRQVLGRRRAPDCQAHVLPVLVLKLVVGVQDLRRKVVGEPGAVDDLPGSLALARERGEVGGVEVVELGVQMVPGAGLIQHVAICLCGGGEPVGNADSLVGELLVHLAQRGVLSPDERHILDADLVEETDVPGCAHNVPPVVYQAVVASRSAHRHDWSPRFRERARPPARGPAGFALMCIWVSSPTAFWPWWCPSPSTPSRCAATPGPRGRTACVR